MPATLPRRRPTLTEVLPARAPKARPGAIRFTPGHRPGTGLVTIHAGRVPCEYLVVEYPTRWDGRAVRLAKVTPGSDATADGYDVFVGRNGQDHRCCCRGHERHGHCKHVDTLRALLENGWLDAALSNPDADVSSDEAPADQPEPAWATEEAARQADAEAADQRAAERAAAGVELPVYADGGEYPF